MFTTTRTRSAAYSFQNPICFSRYIKLVIYLCLITPPGTVLGQNVPANWVGNTLNNTKCPSRPQGYGPFDYLQRKNLRQQLEVVEKHHFTPQVRALVRGQEGTVPGDLDYTLRAWPNHHGALSSMLQYASRKRNPQPLLVPAECYLQRAIHFSPDDVVPRLLFAIYLHKLGLKDKALQQYQETEKISPSNPELHYNMGLLLVSLKQYDEAKKHAIKAYKLGYPLPGLKNKLSRLGYWQNDNPSD